MLCKEEDKCKREDEPCGHMCLNPDFPVWAPWGTEATMGTAEIKEKCLPEGNCTFSGHYVKGKSNSDYRYDSAMYLCNGLCIPTIIPCNNTCQDQVVWSNQYRRRYEDLYGPVTCNGATWWNPFSSDIWTNALQPDALAKVRDIIGQMDYDFGVCLTGNMGCNGTCILDPDRPYAYHMINGEITCSEYCWNPKIPGMVVDRCI